MTRTAPVKLPLQPPPEAASSTELSIVPREGEDLQAAATRMLIGPLASARLALQLSERQSGETLHLAPFADALVRERHQAAVAAVQAKIAGRSEAQLEEMF